MRVVVTGGAGFVGSAVTAALVRTGCHVTVLDDLSAGRPPRLQPRTGRVEFVRASVLDVPALRAACAGASSVVHLAALVSVATSVADPRPGWDVNVTGTLEVLEAARHSGAHVVLASSAAVYGPAGEDRLPLREDSPVDPVSPYAVGKLAAEQLLATWQSCYGVPSLALRFFNVYGPGQPAGGGYAAVVPALVAQALRGGPLRVDGDGGQTRDFVPVATLAGLITRAVLERTAAPGAVNVATGTRTGLLDLAAALERVLGRPLDVEHGPERPGDVRHSCGDPTAMRRLFPGMRVPSLEEGLRATVRWHAAQLELDPCGVPRRRTPTARAITP